MAVNLPPLKIVIAGVDKFSRQFDKAFAKTKKIGGKFKAVGQTMTRNVTAPVGLAGFAVLKTAADFEKAQNKIKALKVFEDVGDGFEKMSKQARTFGKSTEYSATQVANSQAFLAQAGFDTNQILSATPKLLDLATASGTDLIQTFDIASNIMGGFGLVAGETTNGLENTAHVADVLAATTALSNTNLEQLGEAMQQVAPVARGFGASIEDASALVGFFSNIGVQASAAGTAGKNFFTRLAAPAGAARKQLKRLGVDVADANGNIRPTINIIQDLSGKLAKLSQRDKLQALNDIFGARVIAGASALTDDVNKVNSGFEKLAENLTKTQGKSALMAKLMRQGLSAGFAEMISAMEEMALVIADSGLLQFATDMVKGFAGLFQQLSKTSPWILKVGTIFAGLAAIIGPILVVLGNLITVFGAVKAAFVSVGGFAIFGKILAGIKATLTFIVGGIGALPALIVAAAVAWGTVLLTIIKRWDEFVGLFTDGFGHLAQVVVMTGVEMVSDLLSILGFDGFGKQLMKEWELMFSEVLPNMYKKGIDKLKSVGSGIADFLGFGDDEPIVDRSNELPAGSSASALKATAATVNTNSTLKVELGGNVPEGTRVTSKDKNVDVAVSRGLVMAGS